MNAPVILDFDRSVSPLPEVRSIPLGDWQERLRYGCSLKALNEIAPLLDRAGIGLPSLTFLGSGDFHHLSYLLIRRLRARGPFQVIVFDNHPDAMRYPWGIHCGSWVHHVCRLPFVTRVTVIGITSQDIGWGHLWENDLRSLYSGKLFYISLSPVTRLARLIGLSAIEEFKEDPARLPRFIAEELFKRDPGPVYLSIDKDVLSPSVVQTNWDQGILKEEALFEALKVIKPRLIAGDVTGEISFHAYRKWWKRLLSRWDGQSPLQPPDLDRLQQTQQAFNRKLFDLFIQ